MSIAQLSSTGVQFNPVYVTPQVQADKRATPVQAIDTARKTVQAPHTDTVTISWQARQLARGDETVK